MEIASGEASYKAEEKHCTLINSVQSTCTYEVSYMTVFSAKPPMYLIIYTPMYTSSVSWATHEH